MMQGVFNPPKPGKREKKYSSRTFREGDKIMQVKNNYAIEYTTYYSSGTGIYNGDIGILMEVDNEAEKMTVIYDGHLFCFIINFH